MSANTEPAPLDIWESLMVRACKIKRPSLGRFRRILARRRAMEFLHIEDRYVADFLMEIVERYQLRDLRRFIWELNPTELWKCGAPEGCLCDPGQGVPIRHRERVIALCASIIRCTEVSKLPGLRSPSRFNKPPRPQCCGQPMDDVTGGHDFRTGIIEWQCPHCGTRQSLPRP